MIALIGWCDCFKDLIAAVAFLRQYQKVEEVDKHGHNTYRIAYRIMTTILPLTLQLSPLSQSA
jgi:hypothetical protein